jgi:hypothetical protein
MTRVVNSSTRELLLALRAKFPSPEYGMLTEVRDKAGFDGSRSADALVMGLWKSRGYHLHGVEIKASRTDWLRELKNPGKADPICKFCDRWWVVAGEDVVRDGELPTTWGLMVLRSGCLKTETDAPALPEPEPINRSFLASVFRRSIEQSADNTILKAAEAAAYDRGKKDAESRQDWKSQYDALEKAVNEFEEASGLDIQFGWRRKQVGELVRMLLSADPVQTFAGIREAAERVLAAIDKCGELNLSDGVLKKPLPRIPRRA